MSDEASEGREGEVLRGKYKLEKLLGAGGMGEVYRAVNLGIGRTVAIKLLRPEFADRPSVVERFLREARAANAVRHRNVVDVLDIDKDERGTPFIVQEYLEGEDFAAMLQRYPDGLPPGIALSVLGPIIDAVRAAHEKGVVHRDLKPENVFLARLDGVTVPKVLDFGISKLPRTDASVRLTGTHAIMGSPQYMSPEQILTPQQVDARSDIWSLGVMLFECLSGRHPFEGDTAEILFVKICHDEPLSLHEVAPQLPEELQQVVARCLQREPDARFSSATELSETIKQIRRAGKYADVSIRPPGERSPAKPETLIGRIETRPLTSGATGASQAKNASAAALGPTVLASQEVASIPPPRRAAATGASSPGTAASGARARGTAGGSDRDIDAWATGAKVEPRSSVSRASPVARASSTSASVARARGATGSTVQGHAQRHVEPRMLSASGEDGPAVMMATQVHTGQQRQRAPARSVPADVSSEPRVASEMEPVQSSRPFVSTTARPDAALDGRPDAFDVAGMIDGFQAALIVVGLSLLAPRLGGPGLAATRVELGGNFAPVWLGTAALLVVLGARVGLVARRFDAYGFYLASAGLFVTAGSAGVIAITPDDPNALPALGSAVGPWAIVAVALGFAAYGFQRSQTEVSSGRPMRKAYGGVLLVLSLGGAIAAYRVARVAMSFMS